MSSRKRARSPDGKEEEEERKAVVQRQERQARMDRRRAREQEEEDKTDEHIRQARRHEVERAIRRLMRSGSVLDPLAVAVCDSNGNNYITSTINDLMMAVYGDDELRRIGLQMYDGPDAFVAVAKAYEEEVGPVESALVAALMSIVDIQMWPPGLMPIVVAYVGVDGRCEVEWRTVKDQYSVRCDKYKEDWEEQWTRINWGEGGWCRADKGIHDHGWKTKEHHQHFHPLTILGVWSWSYHLNEPRISFVSRLVSGSVRRHPGLVKALALLHFFVTKSCERCHKPHWDRSAEEILNLLILQSSKTFRPEDTSLMYIRTNVWNTLEQANLV